MTGGNTDTRTEWTVSSADTVSDVDDKHAVFASSDCRDRRSRICLLTSDFRRFVKNSATVENMFLGISYIAFLSGSCHLTRLSFVVTIG